MAMEGGECEAEIAVNTEKGIAGDESQEEGDEILDVQSREILEQCGEKAETAGNEFSPRGVLERRESASDSDRSSFGSGRDSSLSCVVPPERVNSRDSNHAASNWKKLIRHLKRRSSKRFHTIRLLTGYDSSKKALRRKHGRNIDCTDDNIDCGDSAVPKPSWRNFTYEELRKATDDFSADNLIGHGGHAEVYKGCLPDGQVIAVKKMMKEEKSEEDRTRNFLTELGIIAHIDHPNTVKLFGFSSDNGLHLVLKFCPHGSLASALHDSETKMDWKSRYKVAIGVAEGLKYLHYDCQRRIIHRDITASNILLEEDYKPQVSDYGLAKWLPEQCLHHRVSPIEGTFGYMAPEYFMNGIVHEKTDVFAFGVLLLELITGRRSIDSSRQSLVMWAKPLLEQNNIKEMIDPRLEDGNNLTEIKRTLYVASTCIHYLPNMRPNMNQVLQVLKGEKETLRDTNETPGGIKILFWDACDVEEDYTSTRYLKDLNRHKELIME